MMMLITSKKKARNSELKLEMRLDNNKVEGMRIDLLQEIEQRMKELKEL